MSISKLLTVAVILLAIINHARQTVLTYVPVVMLGYDVVAYHFNVTGCNSILGSKQYSPTPIPSQPSVLPTPSPSTTTNEPTPSPVQKPTRQELDYIPVVLLGYDVVAYHLNVSGCNSVKGKEAYSYNLTSADENGIDRVYQFWFADQSNLNIFSTDPWKYAPRNGGFCSWGTCCELEEDGWPWKKDWLGPPAGVDAGNCGFRVHTNGYLYFNIWKSYDQRFFSDGFEQRIADAEARWIEWFGSLKAGLFNHQCFSTANNFGKGYCTSDPQALAPRADRFGWTSLPTETPTSASPTSRPTQEPTQEPIPKLTPEPTATIKPITGDKDGVVLDYIPVVLMGYDVVAYQLNVTGCDSMKGLKKYAVNFTSADQYGIDRVYQFWFADENNMNIFIGDPWKYAPRNGGFCSWGTCCELEEDGWPWKKDWLGPPAGVDAGNCGFRVHTNGYLYFNIWKSYDERFFANGVEQRIQDAEDRWIGWFGSLKAGVFNHQCFSTKNNFGRGFCTQIKQAYAPAANPDEEIYTVKELLPRDGGVVDDASEQDTSTRGDGVTDDEQGQDTGHTVVVAMVIVFLVVIIICVCAGVYIWHRQKNKKLIKNFVQLGNEENADKTQTANFDANENVINVEKNVNEEGEDAVLSNTNTQKDTLQETLR